MAVYRGNSFNGMRRDDMKLCQGARRTAAADLPPCTKNEENEREKSCENEKKDTKKGLFDGIIDDFFDDSIDSDKLLIAAILYILIKEGADIKLMLALGYILL